MMATVLVGVGSNLEDRLLNFKKAKELIAKSPQIKILAESAVYETLPQGGPPQGFYLNSVWKLETGLSPQELLKELQTVETKLGRTREIANGPRTIDLDLLDYDGLILDSPELVLPHPRLHEREFVLRPIYSLAPDWVHPKLKKPVIDLWLELHTRHFVSAPLDRGELKSPLERGGAEGDGVC